MDEYLPQGPTETNLVENMAYAKWCEYRAWITETGLYNAEMAANVEKMNEKFVRFDESARTADALESSLALRLPPASASLPDPIQPRVLQSPRNPPGPPQGPQGGPKSLKKYQRNCRNKPGASA